MIDSKQFIITNNGYTHDDWYSFSLSCGKILSYHKELQVHHNTDYSVVLLGHAWSVLPADQQQSPQDFVIHSNCQITEEEIIQEEKTWCGRYLLIANGNIYLDTIGSLGVFYHADAISSSIRILCEYADIPIHYPNIKHREAPDFILGMDTGYHGINRLLPSQVLDLSSLQYHTRRLLPDGHIKKEDEKEQIESFKKVFTTSLANMSSTISQNKIFIALTGGRDSRATLSMFENSNLYYDIFLLQHNRISDGDVYIPPLLSKSINKELKYIKRTGKANSQLYKEYQIHCAGFAVDEDWLFYAYEQYQRLREEHNNLIIIRSSVWEIPNNYYKHYNPEPYDIKKIYPDLINDPQQLTSAENWVRYASNDHINSDIDLWDRTLWELRNGCWTSSIEQSLDILDDITSIQICNCRLFLSFLYGFSEKERYEKHHEEQIANYLCPQFKDIPYDYQGGYVPKRVMLMRKLKYNEEVFRGKIRDFVYGHIIKNGKK